MDLDAEAFRQGGIRSLIALDRGAEALQAYHRCRNLPRAGLEDTPSPATELLIHRIRTGRFIALAPGRHRNLFALR